MLGMFERGQVHGYRFFCLGATEEVSLRTVERIKRDYPRAVVAGRRHGYFTEEDEPRIVAEINKSEADILLVAMSPPKKEQFLARWFPKLDVPVCHGVGGAFDVLAGKTKRAPRIWQRLGMEWFYRILQEPRRMWRRYLVTNTLFAWMLLAEFVRGIAQRGTRRA
jgi:N-acetylglucosaminyldiphosphoundecaprenol N-acetyl-beta-D-mannosaminyltransferase